jgi:hypothetical protein
MGYNPPVYTPAFLGFTPKSWRFAPETDAFLPREIVCPCPNPKP